MCTRFPRRRIGSVAGKRRAMDTATPSPIQLWGVVIDAHVPTASRLTHCGSNLALATTTAPLPHLLSQVIEVAEASGGFLPVMIAREGGQDLFVVTPQGDLVPAGDQIDPSEFNALKIGVQHVDASDASQAAPTPTEIGGGNGAASGVGRGEAARQVAPAQVWSNGDGNEPNAWPDSGWAGGGLSFPTRREVHRESFLTREHIEEPATKGMRGALVKVGIR